jgi:type II secretory pathway pseudopilin PulG
MTIDLTNVATVIVDGIFSIATPVALAWIAAHIKDATARQVLSEATKNALGAMQQAEEAAAKGVPPLTVPTRIANVAPGLAVGVQYVLDHAGDAAERLGYTPEMIASKVDAQIGLASISSNIASAAAPGPTPAPLAPVPVSPPVGK